MSAPVDTDREQLLKRWLRLMVERSSIEELSTRPLAERLKELELLIEAAGEGGIDVARAMKPESDPAAEVPAAEAIYDEGTLAAELDRRLRDHRASGAAFSVALVAGGDDWHRALEATAVDETVFEAAEGTSALVLRGLAGGDARAAVDRLRVSAWRELGAQGRLPEVGVASCPTDGETAGELMAAAQTRMFRIGFGDHRDERIEQAVSLHHERIEEATAGETEATGTATITPLPLPRARLSPQWGPWAPNDSSR